MPALRSSAHARVYFASSAVAVLALSALSHGQEKVTFQDHVRPIFESACNNCHNPDKKKGGLDLSSYPALMAGGSSGEEVTPGDPGASRLLKCVTKEAEPFMPPQGAPLEAKQIETIRKWIEGGLLDTPNGVAKKAKKPAFDMSVAATGPGKPEGPPPMPEHPLLEPVVITPRAQATAALCSSPWAPLVAISGQKQILLYNTDSLELAAVFPWTDGSIEALHFSRNGQMLCAAGGRGGKNGKVVVYDVKSGKRAMEIGEEQDTVLAGDVSADLSTVLIGGPSKRVKLYNTADGALIKEIKKHTDWVTAGEFSPDGVLVATGDRSGGLFVWESRTGNEFYNLAGHGGAIVAVAWRADGNILASASEDGQIMLWEMNEGKQVKKWAAHGGGCQSLAFTHDGRLVSCGRDRTAKLWGQDGKQLTSQNQFSDLPLTACYSHDGGRFIVGDWSGKVTVWDSKDAKALGEMNAAPPSIDVRLAEMKAKAPERVKAIDLAKEQAAAAAAAAAETEAAIARRKKRISDFAARTADVEKNLAEAKAAAEALLVRLKAPLPAPAPSAASMDMGTAVGLATDLATVTREAKTGLNPLSGGMNTALQDFSTTPSLIVSTRERLKQAETSMPEVKKKATEAGAAIAQAQAAVEQSKLSIARLEAAKINAVVYSKRGELEALTQKFEDTKAELESREKTLAEVPNQLASAPAEQKPALEKKLAQAQKGLDELKKSKADLEAQVTLLKKQVEEEFARYLAQLPKS